MGLFSTKTPEQKAAERAQRDYEQWLQTPPGQARLAYQRGDVVLQIALDLAEHRGTIATLASPMPQGAYHSTRSNDVSSMLNRICAEGWDLINGTVVFVPTTQASRDKLSSSGQQVAISGRTVGYYLFRRREGVLEDGAEPAERPI